MSKGKKVLVTGGLGFIGSSLSKALCELGFSVTVVDNMTSNRPDWKAFLPRKNLTVIESCYADRDFLDTVESGSFDTVFHVGAIPRVLFSVENPSKTTENNVLKTVRLLDACNKGSVRRVVFSSSSSVYGGADVLPTPRNHPKNPKSPYAWQKSCIEDYLKMNCNLHGADSVSLRYFNVFGPGQFGGSAYSTAVSAWCHAIKNGLPLRKDGTGEQSRDMCYIDNIVEANILAMKAKQDFSGECYNVACSDRVSNNEILEFLEERTPGLKINKKPFRKGDVMHTQADIEATSSDLGYKPKVRFWSGLEKTLEWWEI